MLIFAENYSYDDPLNIVFLCGSHYSKKSKHDKRNILKEHIDGSTSNLHAIILEENFQFASTSIYNVYRDILRNTVESLTGIDAENFKVSVSLKGTNCTLKQAVGYFLYMLQAANLISLVQISAVSPTTRKIQLSTHLDKYIRHINDALLDIGTTEFGRLVT